MATYTRYEFLLRTVTWSLTRVILSQLKLLNKTIIVLSSGTTVKEVLDRNGMKTGGRPEAHIVRRVEGKIHPVFDSIGTFFMVEFSRSDNTTPRTDVPMWKASRKTFHAFLTSQALESYFPMQQERYLRLLRDILTSPKVSLSPFMTHTLEDRVTMIYILGCGQAHQATFCVDHGRSGLRPKCG